VTRADLSNGSSAHVKPDAAQPAPRRRKAVAGKSDFVDNLNAELFAAARRTMPEELIYLQKLLEPAATFWHGKLKLNRFSVHRDDLVGEGFVAYVRCRTSPPPREFGAKTFADTVVRNCALDILAERLGPRRMSSLDEDGREEPPAADLAPDAVAQRREETLELRRKLERAVVGKHRDHAVDAIMLVLEEISQEDFAQVHFGGVSKRTKAKTARLKADVKARLLKRSSAVKAKLKSGKKKVPRNPRAA